MLSLNIILALTPSLLFFFYLRGESESGSWGPDYLNDPPFDPPCLDLSGPTALIENPSKFQHLSGTLKSEEKSSRGRPKPPKMKPKSFPQTPETRTFAKL